MGILSGLLNIGAQWSANEFNASQAKKQRDWQEMMMNKQMSYNTDMWNKTNEYNSASAQVQRLKEAGLNPSFMGNLSAGSAQSAPSPSPGSGASASANPVQFANITDSILGLVNAKSNKEILKNQAQSIAGDAMLKRIDAQTRGTENIAKILDLAEKSNDNRMSARLKKQAYDYAEQLQGYRVEEASLRNSALASQIEGNVIENLTNLQELSFLPVRQRLEYSEKMADISLMYATKQLTLQQVRTEIQKTNHEYFKAKGQKFLNDLDRKTENFLIRKREKDSRMSSPFEFGDILNDYLNNIFR